MRVEGSESAAVCSLEPARAAGCTDQKLYCSRDLLPDDGVAIRQGVTALRAKLRELPRTCKKAAKKTDFDEIDGYRKRRNKVNQYVIKPATHSIPFSRVDATGSSSSNG